MEKKSTNHYEPQGNIFINTAKHKAPEIIQWSDPIIDIVENVLVSIRFITIFKVELSTACIIVSLDNRMKLFNEIFLID